MANYYNEAREQKRQLKVTSESSRRRAERRAELAAVEVGLPLAFLQIGLALLTEQNCTA